MIENLKQALALLPDLLDKREAWDSLIVNRRKPYTYRVFTQLADGNRVCLHKFDPCHDHEAFAHPHPWSGAFVVLKGSYRMTVGYSKDRESKPENVMSMILTPWSMYEITNPLTWHSVIPLETTYTIMINGQPWAADYAHKEVRTTRGKDLDKMPEDELLNHLKIFKRLLRPKLAAFEDDALSLEAAEQLCRMAEDQSIPTYEGADLPQASKEQLLRRNNAR